MSRLLDTETLVQIVYYSVSIEIYSKKEVALLREIATNVALRVAKAQRDLTIKEKDDECQQKIEEMLKLLPEIPVRYSHNATCFDCVNNIRLQALKKQEGGTR